MNPLAIYKALKQSVDTSPFAKSIGCDFGFEAMSLNLTTRFQITIKPGDIADSVGSADTFAPSIDPRFVAVQSWLTTIQIQADDASRDEADQWAATAALRNWIHAELTKIIPAGLMEIVSQQYQRDQARTNRCAILLVLRTSEWIERGEDAGIEEILAKGEVDQTLLDVTDVYAVP